MNARYYDPLVGMFISPDTIVPDAGVLIDYNRYAYVRGNPFMYNDPTGHCPMCIAQQCAMGPCQRAAQQIGIWGQRAGTAIQNAAVRYGPMAADLAQQWGDKAYAYGDWLLNGENAASASQGADASNAGNTGDPGGLDPNKFDPWKWSKSSYRSGYEQHYGVERSSEYQVHHIIPQDYQNIMSQAGINVHDPRWLREVLIRESSTGVRIHQRLYTDVWTTWTKELGRAPTAREIVNYAKQLEEQYSVANTLFYRTGNGLPGTIDWNKVNTILQGGP